VDGCCSDPEPPGRAVLACSGAAPVNTTSPTPTASVDIKRTKLDISYASLSDQDVHKVSSKKILEGAINAINGEIKKTGGKGEMAMIEFQDVQETTVPDFKKFAEAAAAVKALNPQITADRFADVAIEGMMSATPDCHTYYVDKTGGVHRSRPEHVPAVISLGIGTPQVVTDRGRHQPISCGDVADLKWSEEIRILVHARLISRRSG